MKTIIIALFMLFIMSGCSSKKEDADKQSTELQNQNSQLTQDLASRDQYIENVTQAINEVYSNLENVRSQEKLVLSEKNEMEAQKKLTSQEIRERLLTEIALIDSDLQSNRKTMSNLQSKVNSYKTQYVGLKKMVATLKQSIEEREQAIVDLEQKVRGLEAQVGERDSLITQQNSIIDSQNRRLTTGFYVIGKRGDLEKKGIIKDEGGFLWGLLGATTTLSSGANRRYFRPINKFEETTITVSGRIDEIVPKRNAEFYSQSEINKEESVLSISHPKDFWQLDYLVIITD